MKSNRLINFVLVAILFISLSWLLSSANSSVNENQSVNSYIIRNQSTYIDGMKFSIYRINGGEYLVIESSNGSITVTKM